MTYTVKNAVIDGEKKNVVIKDGIIESVGSAVCGEEVDFGGDTVIPGLLDMHTHGRNGIDFINADKDGIAALKKKYAEAGTTAFIPTLATDTLKKMLSQVGFLSDMGFPVCHIEGRYLNPEKSGAHAKELIKPMTEEEIRLFSEYAGKMKLHFSASYELFPEMLGKVHEYGHTAGLAHTLCNYSQAEKLIAGGLDSFTHLFNCMPQIHHRDGGCVTAALTSSVPAEIISDGLHLSPEIVRLTYRAKGDDGVVLITDSLECAGCPEGKYSVAGTEVTLKNGEARTPTGNLAGSVIALFDGVKRFASFTGISVAKAAKLASENPARVFGLKYGKIAPGYPADFIRLDSEDNVKTVYKDGRAQ
ncbi:MAG: amidohydrolase family protein [Firmicutes bacterium]|nr:amidohydrolase family protein [Candidatus Colimorpha enterica]